MGGRTTPHPALRATFSHKGRRERFRQCLLQSQQFAIGKYAYAKLPLLPLWGKVASLREVG